VVNLFISRQGFAQALKRPSARVLIAVNLSMIAGVILFDWSVLDIVFLYWVENLVVGVINVLRMLMANPAVDQVPGVRARLDAMHVEGSTRSLASLGRAGHAVKLFLIPFFIVHYGGFCYGHGIFVMAMFGESRMKGDSFSSLFGSGFAELMTTTMILAIATLAASHLFSFFSNYVAGGEYRRTHVALLMMRPYGRIVALHITILFGAFLTAFFDSPMGMLIILVVLKTGADLALHQVERKKLGKASN